MYFWLFLNISSDGTKTLFAALISHPEGGGGGGDGVGGDGVAAPPLPILLRGLLDQGLARQEVFFSLESIKKSAGTSSGL